MRPTRGRFRRKEKTETDSLERNIQSPSPRIEVGMEHTLPDFEVKAKGVTYQDVRHGRAAAMQEMKARRARAKKSKM